MNDDLALIRQRPGMYIGDPNGLGVQHMLAIVLDCLGESDNVYIKYDSPRCLTVTMKAAPYAFTELQPQLSKVCIGEDYSPMSFLCVISALTAYFRLQLVQNDRQYSMSFCEGVLEAESQQHVTNEADMTQLAFGLSDDIFDPVLDFNFEGTVARLSELAGLVATNYHLSWNGEHTFQCNNLADFLIQNTALNQPVHHLFKDFGDGVIIEIAYGFTSDKGQIKSWVNTVPTEWGSHESGLTDGLLEKFGAMDGIVAYIHVIHPRAEFENPTKSALRNPEIRKMVTALIVSSTSDD